MYAKKRKIISYLCFKKWLKSWKTSYSFNDFKRGKWHYLAVEIFLVLLIGIISKNNDDFYCLNYLHSFRTKNKRESQKNVLENEIFCDVIMPSKDTKILKFNQYKKSDKTPFIIYADIKCIIEKIDGYKNNSENSSSKKVSAHIPSCFSISIIFSFRCTENKHDVYMR